MNKCKKLAAFAMAVLMLTTLLAGYGCAVKEKPAADGEEPTASPGEEPTEAPKEEIDMSKFPLYVEPEQAVYSFGERGKSIAKAWNNVNVYAPYWQGNIMYNETVMCIDDGTRIAGALLYKPVRILSVRDYTMTTEYEEGKDYTISGNQIMLNRDTTTWLSTEAMPTRVSSQEYRSMTTR